MEKENYDIYNCLELFTKEEVLDKDNEWFISNFFIKFKIKFCYC